MRPASTRAVEGVDDQVQARAEALGRPATARARAPVGVARRVSPTRRARAWDGASAGLADAERFPLEIPHDRESEVRPLLGLDHRRAGLREPLAALVAAEVQAQGEHVEQRLGRHAARSLERGGLTRRELEILRLVAVGKTNREIARELVLSPRTVEMHVRHVLAKLGCRSRTEATTRAFKLGLLESASSR
jgi:DNA-binding CsgD family transcriptional regulator